MNIQQENIERDVRLVIGDLHVQLIASRALVADLQAQLQAAQAQLQAAQEPETPPAVNGKDKPAAAREKPN